LIAGAFFVFGISAFLPMRAREMRCLAASLSRPSRSFFLCHLTFQQLARGDVRWDHSFELAQVNKAARVPGAGDQIFAIYQ
jgi:cytochrome bd-type quinol oxidase subunit 1